MRNILPAIGLGLMVVLLPGLPATAQGWTNDSQGAADRAFYSSRSEGKSLQLGCFKGGNGLRFTLLGGSKPLPASAQRARGVMVWITLPDGRTGRYPVDTEYMGGGDNALIGTLLLGRQGMEFFAGGQSIAVTDPAGTELFRSGMRGTAAAASDFRRRCGL